MSVQLTESSEPGMKTPPKKRARELSQLSLPTYSITKRRSQHTRLYCNTLNDTNPLNNNCILSKIYQYLQFTDILQCILVNQQWHTTYYNQCVYNNKLIPINTKLYSTLGNRRISGKLNQIKHLAPLIQCIELHDISRDTDICCSRIIKYCASNFHHLNTIQLTIHSDYHYNLSNSIRPFDSICIVLNSSNITHLYITYFNNLIDALVHNKQMLSNIHTITILHTCHMQMLDVSKLNQLSNLQSLIVHGGGRVHNQSIIELSKHCCVGLTNNNKYSSQLNIHSNSSLYSRLQMFIHIKQACAIFDYTPIDELKNAQPTNEDLKSASSSV